MSFINDMKGFKEDFYQAVNELLDDDLEDVKGNGDYLVDTIEKG